MHRAETCRAKQERLNKPTIEPRLEIQTKSVVVCATYERTHSQATSELVVRQANFQKGRSVPGRPFSNYTPPPPPPVVLPPRPSLRSGLAAHSRRASPCGLALPCMSCGQRQCQRKRRRTGCDVKDQAERFSLGQLLPWSFIRRPRRSAIAKTASVGTTWCGRNCRKHWSILR